MSNWPPTTSHYLQKEMKMVNQSQAKVWERFEELQQELAILASQCVIVWQEQNRREMVWHGRPSESTAPEHIGFHPKSRRLFV